MISDNVLPPDLKAAIFRALKQLPGVKVDTVEVNGHRVFAVGQTDDWLHQQLLLDAKSYDYVGQIGTVTRDTRRSARRRPATRPARSSRRRGRRDADRNGDRQ